jgi:hypothetical protein
MPLDYVTQLRTAQRADKLQWRCRWSGAKRLSCALGFGATVINPLFDIVPVLHVGGLQCGTVGTHQVEDSTHLRERTKVVDRFERTVLSLCVPCSQLPTAQPRQLAPSSVVPSVMQRAASAELKALVHTSSLLRPSMPFKEAHR